MENPHSEPILPTDSSLKRISPFCGRRTRILLFGVHLAMLVMIIALIPPGYAFELGNYAGGILIFGSLLLWVFLYYAQFRNGILVFCLLALAQSCFMAFIAQRFRSEDKLVQQIMGDLAQQRKEQESQMAQFRMDALFEMCSGKRQLNSAELLELHARANKAEAKAQELVSESPVWITQAENRLAAVSPGAARDFRLGVESSQPESNIIMKLTRDYFAEITELTGFLVQRQGRYRATREGLVFVRTEDAQAFNAKIDTIARLEEQLNSQRAKAEEGFRQISGRR